MNLKINTPCPQNWDRMKITHDGRFCEVCQKTVVDFTRMTPKEIKTYFERPMTGKTCGRLEAPALDTSFFGKQLENMRTFLAPYRKSYAWAAWTLSFLSMVATLTGCEPKITMGEMVEPITTSDSTHHNQLPKN